MPAHALAPTADGTNSIEVLIDVNGSTASDEDYILDERDNQIIFFSDDGMLTVWLAIAVNGITPKGVSFEFDFLTVDDVAPTTAFHTEGNNQALPWDCYVGEVDDGGPIGIEVLADSGIIRIQRIGAWIGTYKAELRGITLTLVPPETCMMPSCGTFSAKGSTATLQNVVIQLPHPTDANWAVKVEIETIFTDYNVH